ncbi:hypothetical protein [Propionibacterium freudenreichii]|nr:hypothetical protein [Propionibacterium freudenreichii]
MNTLADNPVIIEALRTPIGTTGGVFADQTTTDLAVLPRDVVNAG